MRPGISRGVDLVVMTSEGKGPALPDEGLVPLAAHQPHVPVLYRGHEGVGPQHLVLRVRRYAHGIAPEHGAHVVVDDAPAGGTGLLLEQHFSVVAVRGCSLLDHRLDAGWTPAIP